jgi:hypothetical protein
MSGFSDYGFHTDGSFMTTTTVRAFEFTKTVWALVKDVRIRPAPFADIGAFIPHMA